MHLQERIQIDPSSPPTAGHTLSPAETRVVCRGNKTPSADSGVESPPKPMSVELVMPSNHLILCRPLPLLPPIPPSIRVFSSESTSHEVAKLLEFHLQLSPSNEHPGLISFRMDWLDLLAVQGTLRTLLQHHSSMASILWLSAFFIVQLSHPYMTTGKASSKCLGNSADISILCVYVRVLSQREKRILSRISNG